MTKCCKRMDIVTFLRTNSGREINVKILSCGQQSVSSDEEENVSDNSSM
jgi:hypothetical protein